MSIPCSLVSRPYFQYQTPREAGRFRRKRRAGRGSLGRDTVQKVHKDPCPAGDPNRSPRCIFTAYDDEPSWGIAHRIMAPAVAAAGDDTRVKQLQEMAADLVARWTVNCGQRVNVTKDLERLNFQSIIYFFFGQRFRYLESLEPAILATTVVMEKHVLKSWLTWTFG